MRERPNDSAGPNDDQSPPRRVTSPDPPASSSITNSDDQIVAAKSPRRGLLAALANMTPCDEAFPEIEDLPAEEVDFGFDDD